MKYAHILIEKYLNVPNSPPALAEYEQYNQIIALINFVLEQK